MNTIVFIILTIVGLAITPFILKVVILAIWQVVEIPYRIMMLAIYGSLYVLISIWEVIVWAVKVPGRVCNWLSSRQPRQVFELFLKHALSGSRRPIGAFTSPRKSSRVHPFATQIMPKSPSLPLKVIIARVGEPTAAEYGAAKSPVDSAAAAHDFWCSVIRGRSDFEGEKEHLIVVLLDTKLRPKGYHIVSIGTLNETVAHPREVFRPAILISAYAVILMHNHPSGDPSPSQADRRMTRQMSEAAQLLQMQLLDHVIVGSAEGGRQPYFSFREAGSL